jgi:hypothetical protein
MKPLLQKKKISLSYTTNCSHIHMTGFMKERGTGASLTVLPKINKLRKPLPSQTFIIGTAKMRWRKSLLHYRLDYYSRASTFTLGWSFSMLISQTGKWGKKKKATSISPGCNEKVKLVKRCIDINKAIKTSSNKKKKTFPEFHSSSTYRCEA